MTWPGHGMTITVAGFPIKLQSSIKRLGVSQRHPRSCRSGFRDAWMTLRNGCSLIVFNSTQPRRKCSGVHPFDVSIRFHSPVYASALTSLLRPIRSETSEYIWTATSAWGLMSPRWCPAVSRCCGDSAAFVRRLRGQSLSRSLCHWSLWLRQYHTRRHNRTVDGQIAVSAQRVCAADPRSP